MGADPAFVPAGSSQQAVSTKGFNPGAGDNGCRCALCQCDRDFTAAIAHVPGEHRPFLEKLKDEWESQRRDIQALEIQLAEKESY